MWNGKRNPSNIDTDKDKIDQSKQRLVLQLPKPKSPKQKRKKAANDISIILSDQTNEIQPKPQFKRAQPNLYHRQVLSKPQHKVLPKSQHIALPKPQTKTQPKPQPRVAQTKPQPKTQPKTQPKQTSTIPKKTLSKHKILYLIIYNENTPYEVEMKKALERYVYNFNNIDTYFTSLKQLKKIDYIIDGRTIYINGKESFIPGVLHKTIEALKLIVKDDTYDFMIRGNISTVIDFHKVIELLSGVKNNIYASGYMIVPKKNNNFKYASGTSIILDKHSLRFLLDHLKKMNYGVIDDIAIGRIMTINKGVSYIGFPGFKINTKAFEDVTFFRNKSKNRMDDVVRMNKIIDYLLAKYWDL